mmetsp:Transcript_19039/g.41043  ORF Transcript_19039/g.41043 Transcript_19039/m.41043 type:complete len:201 (+) Transcript_19039:2416-3018(+)
MMARGRSTAAGAWSASCRCRMRTRTSCPTWTRASGLQAATWAPRSRVPTGRLSTAPHPPTTLWCSGARSTASSASPLSSSPPRTCCAIPRPSPPCGSLTTSPMTPASWVCASSASSWTTRACCPRAGPHARLRSPAASASSSAPASSSMSCTPSARSRARTRARSPSCAWSSWRPSPLTWWPGSCGATPTPRPSGARRSR